MSDGALDPATVEGLHDLGRMSADGPARIRQLVGTFVVDATSRAAQLGRAVASGDASQVHSLAHSLAGSSANLGAHVVAAISRNLEAAGRAGDLTGASGEVARLDVALVEAIAAFRLEFGVTQDDDHSR